MPKGFADGFVILIETAIFSYEVDQVYMPSHEQGIFWSDIDLNIDWKIESSVIKLSEKDKGIVSFKDFFFACFGGFPLTTFYNYIGYSTISIEALEKNMDKTSIFIYVIYFIRCYFNYFNNFKIWAIVDQDHQIRHTETKWILGLS